MQCIEKRHRLPFHAQNSPVMSNFMMNGVNFTVAHGIAPAMATLDRSLDTIKNFIGDERLRHIVTAQHAGLSYFLPSTANKRCPALMAHQVRQLHALEFLMRHLRRTHFITDAVKKCCSRQEYNRHFGSQSISRDSQECRRPTHGGNLWVRTLLDII